MNFKLLNSPWVIEAIIATIKINTVIPKILNMSIGTPAVLSNKTKFDRKDPETQKRRFFEIRAKSAKIVKNRQFHSRRALCAKNEVFADFCPDFKG